MTHAVDVGALVEMASFVLYLLLGAWTLSLTPRRLQTKLLAAFTLLFGLATAWETLLVDLFHVAGSPSLLLAGGTLLFKGSADVVILALVWSVPEPLDDRRLLGAALALGAVLWLPQVPVLFAGGYDAIFPPLSGAVLWFRTANQVLVAVAVAAGVLLPLRARPARDPDPGHVTQLAILAVAFVAVHSFVLGVAFTNAAGALAAGNWGFVLFAVSGLSTFLAVSALWGWNMIEAGEETVRTHRAAMLGTLGFFAGGAVVGAAFPDLSPVANLTQGLIQTVGVGLLAYGILRHDLAGLDEKVQFGVSKTTVGAIFVAVFFVVSEGAQILLAGFAGSEILGVLAAGALVFVLAPIQRAADRLAADVVPGQAQASGRDREDAEDAYRRALRMVLEDGEVTRGEERELLVVAERLGIDNERAFELREQVEDEAEAGGAP